MEPSQVTLVSFFTNLFAFFGGGAGTYTGFEHVLANVWLAVTILGYLASFGGLVVIAWALMRLGELRKREDAFYGAIIAAPESEQTASPRWQHIEALAASGNPSALREAILEADIMLDDMLSRQGYAGEGVGEKLRQVNPATFSTLRDAQEAHGVRNRIAHQGSTYDLSDTLAQRTLARYQAVFREFGLL